MKRLNGWAKVILVAGAVLNFENAAQALGGVSGGGGNVIQTIQVTDFASVNETVSRIKWATGQVIPFLGREKALLKRGRLSGREAQLFGRLLNDADDVYGKILSRPIFIETTNSCFNSNDQAVDGCIFSSRPGTVCISAKTISEKLNRKQIAAQSLALLIHEYAELNGFDEADSIEMQTLVLKKLLP